MAWNPRHLPDGSSARSAAQPGHCYGPGLSDVRNPDDMPGSVLVVDDSAANRRKMSLAVRNLGHRVEVASGGAEALETLREGSFDAVLLDILMPDVDGYDVLRPVKADPELGEVPIIVVSALDGGSVVKAIELGAEDFLPAAFDFVVLRARRERRSKTSAGATATASTCGASPG